MPANGFPDRVGPRGGLRGKGLLAWLRAPLRVAARGAAGGRRAAARAAARGARRGRLRQRPRRHGGVAAAHAAADPRTKRDRRHDQPLARARRDAGAGGLSRQLRPGRARALHRQSGARRHRRAAGAGAALRRPPGPRAAAGARRQPGRAAPERRACRGRWRCCAAQCARRCGTRPASAASRRARAPTRRPAVEAEVLPFIDDMAGGICLGGPGGMPRRRADGRRIAGRRPRRGAGALPGGRRRPPDPQRRGPWCARRRLLVQERDLDRRALGAGSIGELAPDRARLLAHGGGRTRGRRHRCRRAARGSVPSPAGAPA